MNNFDYTRIKHFFSYYLVKPHAHGKGIHSPLILDFVRHVLLPEQKSTCKEINLLHKQLKSNQKKIEIEDFGAGSAKNKHNIRQVSEIARNSSSTKRKGKLLFNLVNYYQPKTIIELGTSLGIGTLYMAKASPHSQIFTLEGSKELHKIASENFIQQKITNCYPITGKFDDTLPDLLKQYGIPNMVFIDGNHTYDATMRYFNLFLKNINSKSILIFDDIRWSEGMYKAWREICGNQTVKISIDLLDIGIVFFNDSCAKEDYCIYYS